MYELYTVDDIYSADGTKLLDAGTKLATSSTTNASGFTWFDVDVPIRGEYYIDPAGPRSTSRENSGRYRIVEITAPAGYLLDSTPVDVDFTYEGQQTPWQVVDGTNTNLRTTVAISKQDITTGEELPGAKLQVIDKNGDVIEEWTSTKEPHYLEAVLKAGETYALHEVIAPDGYAIANDVEFTVNADGTVTEVVMYDDAVPVTKSTPNTGDSGRNSLAYLMLAGSVIIFAALAISRKKKRRSEKADKNAAFCPDFVEVEHENE